MKLKPRHSFTSVVEELVGGLQDGTISISRGAEPAALAASISDQFTTFLSYTLNSDAEHDQFRRELESALSNATSRIWLCSLHKGNMPNDFALMKPDVKSLDMRLIIPWDETVNDQLFTTCTRRYKDSLPDGEGFRENLPHFWLLIIDDIAYCRFLDLHERTRDWGSLVFKIDAQHKKVFEMCEHTFRDLWDDTALMKPIARYLQE